MIQKIEDELRIDYLLERGYIRKKCKICGEHFWTVDPDRNTCGEAPCEPYQFIGTGLDRKFGCDELRERYLRFFEHRGHKRINRYPVVAKWREDLFLTDASIIDFQPYVTEGLIPPPANPLTISQVCIRLKDIDKVGLTLGRHLTIFEMMAHHAFNRPNREIYWKNETVKLHHEFAMEVLGVKDEDIIYKEGIWEGGGNAGPDFECIIKGLETATLVFMSYKVKNGNYEKLPTRTVDTGYGLERMVWLSNGSPTAFQPVYPNQMEKFRQLLGVKLPDEKLLNEYSKISSLMVKVERGVSYRSIRMEAAKILNIDWEELDRILTPIERLFGLLDHTKTITFMLADGLIPSNTNEGYLGRLVIRRALKLLRLLGANVNLSDLVDIQIRYLSESFPELRERRDRILEIVDLEERRFKQTIDKGIRIIGRMIKEGRRKFTPEVLIELYDTYGLPPEIVREVAYSKVDVVVPDNFYELVAKKHYSTPPTIQEVVPFEKETANMPPTEPLYYEDPYIREFNARILKIFGKYVVLDKTAFYPEGGGQPSDTGTLKFENSETRVVSVKKSKDVIIHEVEDTRYLKVGMDVKGFIDWEKRLSLMRHHTGTHILLEACKRVLGDHVRQAGAQKGPRESRLDIAHYKPISEEELVRIEVEANRAIMSNLPVITRWVDRDKAEREYGFDIYQGGVVPGVKLRIVEIKKYNIQACGGTHVRNTGEVGPIRIIRSKRIQDGVVRLEFAAGIPALQLIEKERMKVRSIARKLGVDSERVDEAVSELLKKEKSLKKQVEELYETYNEILSKKLLESAVEIDGLKFIVHSETKAERPMLIDLGGRIIEMNPNTIVVLTGGGAPLPLVVMLGSSVRERGGDAVEIIHLITGGRGGGDKRLAQGAVSEVNFEKMKEIILKYVRKLKT